MTAPRKPRQRRKEARPGEIISSAMQLWAERGFAATRLEDVAKGAGIAKGTIYLYFPSKEALFEAALKERLVPTVQQAEDMVVAFDGTTDALLRHFYRAVFRQMFDQGASTLLKVLIAEGHRFPDLVAAYRSLAMDRGLLMLRSIIARGVALGDLRPEARDTDPRLLMAPVIMRAIWSLVFAEEHEPVKSEEIEAQIDLLMLGLANPR